MQIDIGDFLVKEDKGIELDKISTKIDLLYKSKKEYKKILKTQIKEMKNLQQVQYASNKYSFLIIFQAMDAAGKDSTIKRVMSGVNPQGCRVTSFKQPSQAELEHDFLWRSTVELPQRGNIGIFNRSYYEEVLIVKVHPEILSNQGLPNEVLEDECFWDKRYDSINNFESHLNNNGTKIIKFFLNISKEEQKKRFIKRIDQENKNWKFNISDIKERKYWDEYIKAYQTCISKTSTKDNPWYVIPSDDKKNIHLIVSQIIVETFKGFDMSYPVMSKEHLKELQIIRQALNDE